MACGVGDPGDSEIFDNFNGPMQFMGETFVS